MSKNRTFELKKAMNAFDEYVSKGYRTWDMADHYANAERFVGSKEKETLTIMTKWCPPPGEMTKDVVEKAIQERLKRLRTDRLDLLQFHWWNYHDLRYLDAVRELKKMIPERIRRLGVTNFDTAHLRILLSSGIPIVSNQVCFSLLDRRAEGQMSELCENTGVRLFAFGTLGGGLLTDRFLEKKEPKRGETESLRKYLRFVKVGGGWKRLQALLRALRTVADELDCDIAHVAAGWVLRQRAVASVIVGVRLGLSTRADANLDIVRVSNALTDAHLAIIDAAKMEPIPGDCGDEYRKPPFLTATGDLSDHLVRGTDAAGSIRSSNDGHVRGVNSGTVWEEKYGYSRAVRAGDRIYVSGTTATHRGFAVGTASTRSSAKVIRRGATAESRHQEDDDECEPDAYAQAAFALDKVTAAVDALCRDDETAIVVRTRLIVPRLEKDWEGVANAHGRVFGDAEVPPSNTLVGGALVGKTNEYLVEIEAEAVVRQKSSSLWSRAIAAGGVAVAAAAMAMVIVRSRK